MQRGAITSQNWGRDDIAVSQSGSINCNDMITTEHNKLALRGMWILVAHVRAQVDDAPAFTHVALFIAGDKCTRWLLLFF